MKKIIIILVLFGFVLLSCTVTATYTGDVDNLSYNGFYETDDIYLSGILAGYNVSFISGALSGNTYSILDNNIEGLIVLQQTTVSDNSFEGTEWTYSSSSGNIAQKSSENAHSGSYSTKLRYQNTAGAAYTRHSSLNFTGAERMNFWAYNTKSTPVSLQVYIPGMGTEYKHAQILGGSGWQFVSTDITGFTPTGYTLTIGVAYAGDPAFDTVYIDDVSISYVDYATSGMSIGDNYTINIDVTEIPTIIPTATPTPVPELCGFWTLTVNTSNIKMNEYVLGSLTDTDPSDRFDMIDWYRVLPNGQEHLALHYVYDPGLFGLGAGWFEVTPTGIATPSSEAQAKENAIQITTAGANYLRAKIYDDVSLLPMVYHDYDLVCTLNQIVYVGETTQAINQLGINTYEADTFSLLSGVSIGVYDFSSGGWQNKTSAYGETTYFNVIPGNAIRVLAQKTGWIPSDTNITVPSPPGIYPVYLKRPLVDVVNESYAFFNVRDSITRTGLYQANIQLSDGQVQSTLPSGYAGFSVDDGVTYYYTVTKPGYQAYTGSFSITEDTTFPISLVQIAPTPTLTLPTTYPTSIPPTVSGTATPITTGTISPTGSATPFQTLSAEQRTEKTTKAMDFWIDNAETLGYVLFLAAIMGAFGLVMDSMGGNRRRRR